MINIGAAFELSLLPDCTGEGHSISTCSMGPRTIPSPNVCVVPSAVGLVHRARDYRQPHRGRGRLLGHDDPGRLQWLLPRQQQVPPASSSISRSAP